MRAHWAPQRLDSSRRITFSISFLSILQDEERRRNRYRKQSYAYRHASVIAGSEGIFVITDSTESAIATNIFSLVYKIRFLKVTIDEVRILDCGSRKDASRFTRKCLVASFGSIP